MKYSRPRPLRPERLRRLERPFGWIPFRLLAAGWLPRLSHEAKLLYFFLCLVADGQGISYYGDARLCRLLGLSGSGLGAAREELYRLDLLAFDGRVYQLLSLPHEAPNSVPTTDRKLRDQRQGEAIAVGQILQRMLEEK